MNPLKNNVCSFYRREWPHCDHTANCCFLSRLMGHSQFDNKMNWKCPWNACFNVFIVIRAVLYLIQSVHIFIKGSFYDCSKLSSICRLLLTDLSLADDRNAIDCQHFECIITFLKQRKEREEDGGKYRSMVMQWNGRSPRLTMSFISLVMNGNAASADNNFVME